MENVFEAWIGQPVILKVALGQFRIALPGKLLMEYGETLLMRPQYGPDLKISKTKVLAIEELTQCSGSVMRFLMEENPFKKKIGRERI